MERSDSAENPIQCSITRLYKNCCQSVMYITGNRIQECIESVLFTQIGETTIQCYNQFLAIGNCCVIHANLDE